MLDSVYLHCKSRRTSPRALWPVLKEQVEEAIKHWREPDRGIWEVRGEPQHFTSKVMCWVALDRGRNWPKWGSKSYAQRWRAIADEIKADILANGVDSRGVFTQRYGNDALDASLLLVPLVRFLPPDDPRVRDTVLAIAEELTGTAWSCAIGWRRPTTACPARRAPSPSALLAGVGAGRDRRGEPGPASVRAAAVASPARCTLYAEEIRPSTGRHLGNFPQAFTHPALINAVVHVIRRRREDGTGCSSRPTRPRSPVRLSGGGCCRASPAPDRQRRCGDAPGGSTPVTATSTSTMQSPDRPRRARWGTPADRESLR